MKKTYSLIIIILILIISSICIPFKKTYSNNIENLEKLNSNLKSDVAYSRIDKLENSFEIMPLAAKWHTVTLIPASTNSYSSNITSAKVKVGDRVGSGNYEVTSINGTTIKVKAWGDLYGSFFLPRASELWYGSIESDYVIWIGEGNSNKKEGTAVLLPQSNASAYYYFNTLNSVEYNIWDFTLKYDANGGVGVPEKQNYGTSNKYEKSHDFVIPKDVPTREGYKFLGWSESATAMVPSYEPNSNYRIYQSGSGYNGGSTTKTLYAVWNKIPEKVTLTYIDRGVQIGEIEIYDKGTDITIKSYNNQELFLGWSTNKDSQTADWNPGDKMRINQNTILYAVWEERTLSEFDYIVEWYDAKTNQQIKLSEVRYALIDEVISATEKDKIIEGYIFDEKNEKNKLSSTLTDSNTILKLYFYKINEDGEPEEPEDTKVPDDKPNSNDQNNNENIPYEENPVTGDNLTLLIITFITGFVSLIALKKKYGHLK